MRKYALALALALFALVPAAAHAKGTKTHERNRIVGHSAYADWEYTNGNIITFVNVATTLNDDPSTTPNGVTEIMALAISQAEIDTGNVLITGVAYVEGKDNFSLDVDHDLGTATLHVRNAIFEDDNSFTFFNVDMDLTWTATADAVTMKSHENLKEPGLHLNSQFQGTFRDATATGTIVGKGQNFTPVPSSNGQLQNNKFGQMTITTTTP